MSGYNDEYAFDMESGSNSKDRERQTLTTLDEQAIRLGFIRKVYGILSLQLAFTVAFSTAAMLYTPLGNFLIAQVWLLIIMMILMIVFMCMLACCTKVVRTVPTNYIVLGLFTFTMSYMVGYTCATYQQSGLGSLVLMAAGMTLVMTVSLTLYACFTKTDITMWGGVLFCISIGLTIFMILAIVIGSNWLYMVLSCIAVVLYGIYLVYDTQLIMGNKRYKLSEEDYIIGALCLYVDIIMIFLYILEILGYAKS